MRFFEVQTRTAWGRTLEFFANFCRPQAGWIALDVGCGPGLLSALLAERGCRAYGIDVALFPRSDRLHHFVAQADVAWLPFATGTFDLVTAVNVLFLLPDPGAALAEASRLLRPEGRFAVLNPSEWMSVPLARRLADERRLTGLDRQSLLGWAANAEAHPRWTEMDLARMFENAGLRLSSSILKVGPGLARLAQGIKA